MMKKAPQGCKEQWLPKPKKKEKKEKKLFLREPASSPMQKLET